MNRKEREERTQVDTAPRSRKAFADPPVLVQDLHGYDQLEASLLPRLEDGERNAREEHA